MADVFLGLGSNVGDRLQYLYDAIDRIKNLQGVKLVKCSSVYYTEPWGYKEQSDFLNCVIKIETVITPDVLFKELKDIENNLGRISRLKWHEREIDIDILFYDNLIYNDETLNIPHSQLEFRNFVLVPLNEIASDVEHPVHGKSVKEMVSSTVDYSKVTLYK